MPKNRRRAPRHRTDRPEGGQSLVEIALILPLLILILMGLLDLGRAYMTLIAMNDAAAEGASYAAFQPGNDALIQERAADATGALVQLQASNITVQDSGSRVSGQSITVIVQFDYVLLTPIVSWFVPGGTLAMTASDTRVIY